MSDSEFLALAIAAFGRDFLPSVDLTVCAKPFLNKVRAPAVSRRRGRSSSRRAAHEPSRAVYLTD